MIATGALLDEATKPVAKVRRPKVDVPVRPASVAPSITVTAAPTATPAKPPTAAAALTANDSVRLSASITTAPSALRVVLFTFARTVEPDTLTVKLRPAPKAPPPAMEPATKLALFLPSATTDTVSAERVLLSIKASVLPLSNTTSPLPAKPAAAPPAAPTEICATELVDTALTSAAPLANTRAPPMISALVLRSTISVPKAPDTPTPPMARAEAELATMAWLAAITSRLWASFAPAVSWMKRALSM